MLRSLLLLLCLALQAADSDSFQTPSGNIMCHYVGIETRGELRCDVLKNEAKVPPRPDDCELDFGNAFGLPSRGKAHRLCAGDTVADPEYPVLAYGKTWTAHGITCRSESAGLTCRNRQGRGFRLSRSAQTIF